MPIPLNPFVIVAIGVILDPIPNGGPDILFRISGGVIEVGLQRIIGGEVIEGDLSADDGFVRTEIDVDAAIVDPWARPMAPARKVSPLDRVLDLIAVELSQRLEKCQCRLFCLDNKELEYAVPTARLVQLEQGKHQYWLSLQPSFFSQKNIVFYGNNSILILLSNLRR